MPCAEMPGHTWPCAPVNLQQTSHVLACSEDTGPHTNGTAVESVLDTDDMQEGVELLCWMRDSYHHENMPQVRPDPAQEQPDDTVKPDLGKRVRVRWDLKGRPKQAWFHGYIVDQRPRNTLERGTHLVRYDADEQEVWHDAMQMLHEKNFEFLSS